ncbi:hypothetical protein KTG15_02680 [Methanobacterium sp. YSL]|nr:hypothetical protein [Methanobacterium sp. YSL]
MLQIISGKFFKNEEIITNNGTGITYSNFHWRAPIETCIATIEPVDLNLSSASSYVINYKHQIEKGPGKVKAGNSEILEQFQLLCTFGLQAFFDHDKNYVEMNCRFAPRNSADEFIPSLFVSRFFNLPVRSNETEIEEFILFVEKVISLPRDTYISVIESLKAFSHSLQFLNYNMDLAYSMMIYCLESLSQRHDNFEPDWESYDPQIKDKFDKLFEEETLSETTIKNIQEILINSRESKLMKRFISFSLRNISDSYFLEDADGIKNPLKKSELERVLRNAYKMRSVYVHRLEEIETHLKIPLLVKGDVILWEDEPYLTFRGLVRLVHHIIINFIYEQESLETEEYDWRNDVPGIITMEIHPKHWIWKADEFTSNQSVYFFSKFLSMLSASFLNDEKMENLIALMFKIEKLMKEGVKKEFRPSMISLYCLFNSLASPGYLNSSRYIISSEYNNILDKGLKYVVKNEYNMPMINSYLSQNQIIETVPKSPNHKDFVKKYGDILNQCSIESIITRILLHKELPWDIEEITSCYLDYEKKKFNKYTIVLPNLFELYIILIIGDIYLEENNLLQFEKWFNKAIFELSGKIECQKLIKKHILTKKVLYLDQLLDCLNEKN